MATAELVSPTSASSESYRRLVADFVGHGEALVAFVPGFDQSDFDAMVARLARVLGIEQALVTCGKANVGSARAIVHNGGVLASEEYLPDRGEIVQRWHIDTGQSGA
jgi:hypothetical protein